MSLEVIQPDWPAPANVHAFVTTRNGGVSAGPWKSMNLGLNSGDDPNVVAQNREALNERLPCPPQWLRQVHGTRVVEHSGRLDPDPEADAILSSTSGQVCAVLTADCLPVLLCDTRGKQVAAAHAGWRGLAAGVLQKVVERMRAKPGELMAWLGPAIGPSAYEVGDEVMSAFADDLSFCFYPHVDRWLLDLYAAARSILTQSGVPSISGGDFCTFSNAAQFYSYRRDGVTGRMASVIWLDGPKR
jgi:YfiH family protein